MGQQNPVRDQQTVTPDWHWVQPPIDGVTFKWIRPVLDERGEVCEVYRPAWGLSPEPMVYCYQAIVRPGAIKGWVCHERQSDRIFTNFGFMQWVLYDDRGGSPTFGMINEFNLSERNRAAFVIPLGVWHAVRNVGVTDAVFLNLPTRPYEHADPDKLRLPLENDRIPYRFRPAGPV